MKNRSLSALAASCLLMAAALLTLSGCRRPLYYHPEYNYAGRATPPSGLLERVLVGYTASGTTGGLEIVDGLKDLRGNIQNTIKSFSISGYSGNPVAIINFPEETAGYAFSSDGTLTKINYSTEAGAGSVAAFGANSPSAAAAPTGLLFAGAQEQAGVVTVVDDSSVESGTYNLNLPNVNKVVIDQGAGVILAMVRNSNSLYRVVKLPNTNNPVTPPGSVDCEPLLVPVYCVVPVAGAYDHPSNVSFSLDGSTAYVLNCGPECGGTTASVSFLQMSALNVNLIPTVDPLSAGAPSPLTNLPVANPIPIPGGVTAALSDGNYLYLAGQQLQASGPYSGLFAGNLTLLNLSTYAPGAPVSISDGTHTRLLFADNNTLWIGASQCANGVRAAVATAELNSRGYTDQAGNDNCLTMVTLGSSSPAAKIIPAVVQSTASTVAPVTVAYPNTDQNQYYYGSLTGICWVQNYGKVYTAYGGQVHAFHTADGSEIDNFNITVQGTANDVAYMDALTNSAN